MAISDFSGIRHNIQPKIDFDQGLLKEPSQTDADFFSTAIRMAAPPENANLLPPMLASALADRVQASDKSAHQLMRHMKSAAKAEDPTDITQMSRELSTFSLQTAVTTKVVNKTAQMLDKLSNLQ